MSMESIERVPVTDWLMGVTVLACGVIAIIAAWRCCDRLGGAATAADEGPDEGRGPGDWPTPLALSPGPSNGVVVPDEVEEELWRMIDDEHRRTSVVAEPERSERIAARARGAVAESSPQSDASPHRGQRHRRSRGDRRVGGPKAIPRLPGRGNAHESLPKRRSWVSRADR